MAWVIKKRSKGKEVFSPSKLKQAIQKSAKEAGLSPSKIKSLIKLVANPLIAKICLRKSVSARAIRRAVLGRLDRNAKPVARAWRKYDRTTKYS